MNMYFPVNEKQSHYKRVEMLTAEITIAKFHTKKLRFKNLNGIL